MNFLGFVLSLLLMISFGILSLNETSWSESRLRSTYLGHVHASRKLFNAVEQKEFSSLPSISKKETPKQTTTRTKKNKEKPEVKTNPECARLNLWPLTQGPDAVLQAKALQLLQTFYGASVFGDDPAGVGVFFKEFLAKLQEEKGEIQLEKLRFDKGLQKKYYAMLKGCKHFEPKEGIGYPSLLEIVKIDKVASKICLSHAHLGMYFALLGPKNGLYLYALVQGEQKEAEIEKILRSAALLEFVDLGKSVHPKNTNITLVAEDSDVVLRKTIYRNSASAL